MVEINFFSDSKSDSLYPLNLGRCISTLSYGGRSISTQWKEAMDGVQHRRIRLNSRLLPSGNSIDTVLNLRSGDQWIHDGILIAVAHDEFVNIGIDGIRKLGAPKHVIYDLKYVLKLNESDLRL